MLLNSMRLDVFAQWCLRGRGNVCLNKNGRLMSTLLLYRFTLRSEEEISETHTNASVSRVSEIIFLSVKSEAVNTKILEICFSCDDVDTDVLLLYVLQPRLLDFYFFCTSMGFFAFLFFSLFYFIFLKPVDDALCVCVCYMCVCV